MVAVFLSLVACSPDSGNSSLNSENSEDQLTVISLDGRKLAPPILGDKVSRKLESNLDSAENNFKKNPGSEMNIIWYGRRLAYLYHYKEAIEIFSQGLEQFPDSYKLLRHRGHRYISIRQFGNAVNDLEKASQLIRSIPLAVEPDGQPNKLNIPLSTTQFNIWYHLGLAYYLQGEYDKAYNAYQECLKVSNNNDLLVATTDWLYMTCRKLGLNEEAQNLLESITEDMEVIENDSYLKRLLMYKGLIEPNDLLSLQDVPDDEKDLVVATQGYGVGNYFLSEGDTAKATEIFQQVIRGKSWSAFGYIAAEADLMRLNK